MAERSRTHVEFPGTGVRVTVPEDLDGEDEAIAAAFDKLVADGYWPAESGPAIPAEDLYEELGCLRRKGS